MADALSPAQELVALRAGAVTAAAEIKAANDLLSEAQGQVTALTGERDHAKAEVTRLTGELGTANTNLSAVTGERDTARTEAANLKHGHRRGWSFFAFRRQESDRAHDDRHEPFPRRAPRRWRTRRAAHRQRG